MLMTFANTLGRFCHTHEVHLRTLCVSLCRMFDEHRLVTNGGRHPMPSHVQEQGLITCGEVGQFVAVQALFGIGLARRTRAEDRHADLDAVRCRQGQAHGDRDAMSIAQRL
ncbi:hypothetical protein D3C79_801430 [compost metagenome]